MKMQEALEVGYYDKAILVTPAGHTVYWRKSSDGRVMVHWGEEEETTYNFQPEDISGEWIVHHPLAVTEGDILHACSLSGISVNGEQLEKLMVHLTELSRHRRINQDYQPTEIED